MPNTELDEESQQDQIDEANEETAQSHLRRSCSQLELNLPTYIATVLSLKPDWQSWPNVDVACCLAACSISSAVRGCTVPQKG